MEPWKLTDEEIQHVLSGFYSDVEKPGPDDRAVATAAGQKVLRLVQERFQKAENVTEFAEWLKGQGL